LFKHVHLDELWRWVVMGIVPDSQWVIVAFAPLVEGGRTFSYDRVVSEP
jgi:hypothetical protein